MKKHNGFTMIELIFVIVIIGILSKYGIEFMTQAYSNFIHSKVNNTLQSDSASSIEFLSKRLQERIKSSVIVSAGANTAFNSISIGENLAVPSATVLEWIGSDVDGFRGNDRLPNWSSIIDINITDVNLISPETNTTAINSMINTLSPSGAGINNAALYFIGSNDGDINQYGWHSTVLGNMATRVMFPITTTGTTATNQFASTTGSWVTTDVYEYYKLAWTAYAVAFENPDANGFGELAFYYDYRPWAGDIYTDGTRVLLMQNVTAFRFLSIKSMIKIQICVATDLLEDYSICKEKTIF